MQAASDTCNDVLSAACWQWSLLVQCWQMHPARKQDPTALLLQMRLVIGSVLVGSVWGSIWHSEGRMGHSE